MKITPKIKSVPNAVPYRDMKDGQVFLCDGRLWMKITGGDQEAVDLTNGTVTQDFCESICVPVNTELKWTHKPKKK